MISIDLSKSENSDLVRITGPIDAEAEVHLMQLVPKLGGEVTFNFRNVSEVNSCGVRSWINFLRELGKSNRAITYEECNGEIVMQMNMIPSFKGSAKVTSVFGNYVCDNCEHELEVLFKEGENLPSGEDIDLPSIKCKECGEDMEFEEVEEDYFNFLSA
jgi:anti-anti-sigma regulatory factor/DNA-directed RNA polymerase subunit RPC12/RpoP